MKKVNYLLAAAAMVVGLASCNNDEEVIANANDTKVSLQINQVGLAGVETKYGIREAAFSNNEEIGVYINNGALGTAYNSGTGSTRRTENVKYAFDGSTWESDEPIMLTSTKGIVRAYYPYKATNNGNNGTNIPVTILAEQGTGQSDGSMDNGGQTDYMFASQVVDRSNASATTAAASLTMNHALAMLTFKFKDDATNPYPNEGKVTKIKLVTAAGDAKIKSGSFTMNIATGALTEATPTADAGITVQPSPATPLKNVLNNESLYPRIMIAPLTTVAANSTKVTVTMDNADYSVFLPELLDGFKAGTNYEYTFTLKGTALVISNVTIKTWSKSDQGSVDMQNPDQI